MRDDFTGFAKQPSQGTRQRVVTAGLLLFFGWFLGRAHAATAPGTNTFASGPRKGPAPAFFTNGTVLHIRVEVPRQGIDALRQTGWGGGQRPIVRATVKEGEKTYTNVAVHLKGAAGSFRPIDQNPCLTLNFD